MPKRRRSSRIAPANTLLVPNSPVGEKAFHQFAETFDAAPVPCVAFTMALAAAIAAMDKQGLASRHGELSFFKGIKRTFWHWLNLCGNLKPEKVSNPGGETVLAKAGYTTNQCRQLESMLANQLQLLKRQWSTPDTSDARALLICAAIRDILLFLWNYEVNIYPKENPAERKMSYAHELASVELRLGHFLGLGMLSLQLQICLEDIKETVTARLLRVLSEFQSGERATFDSQRTKFDPLLRAELETQYPPPISRSPCAVM